MTAKSSPAEPEAHSGVVGGPRYGGKFYCEGSQPLSFVLPGERVSLPAPTSPEPPGVLVASAERATPRCVHFGVCGGCHYQHAEYATQLRWKREVLAGLLADSVEAELPGIAVRGSEPWGYRNRIRLRLERAGDGAEAGHGYRLGYSLALGNEFLPIEMCPIAAPLLWRAAETLLSLAGERECERWLAATAEVELFCLGDESRLQATLLLREAGPGLRGEAPGLRGEAAFAGLCRRWQEALPQLAGAGVQLHPELGRRARGSWAGERWGAAGLMYTAGGYGHWVGRGAFFQVNRFLVDQLVERVCEGETGGLAWDLYAGVGLFTRALVDRFAKVTAVEGSAHAAAALLAASRVAGGKGAPAFAAVHAATLEFLKTQRYARERPELVVVDPPRAGLGAATAEVLAQIGAARLVYVSCDPVTLARDLKVLTRRGYRVRWVELVDLFPQTFHIETVVHLSRG